MMSHEALRFLRLPAQASGWGRGLVVELDPWSVTRMGRRLAIADLAGSHVKSPGCARDELMVAALMVTRMKLVLALALIAVLVPLAAAAPTPPTLPEGVDVPDWIEPTVRDLDPRNWPCTCDPTPDPL